MFLVGENGATDQVRRRGWYINPRATTPKRTLERELPSRNYSENPDESQMKSLNLILIEPLFEYLRTKDVQIGKRLDRLQI